METMLPPIVPVIIIANGPNSNKRIKNNIIITGTKVQITCFHAMETGFPQLLQPIEFAGPIKSFCMDDMHCWLQ